MPVVRRLLTGLLVILLAVVLVAGVAFVGVVGWVTGRALPQVAGTIHVPGLAGPVQVIRDESGIAQVYADTPDDLFFAQGYVHAQDRLWQMEVWRHIASGRLSELFGASQLDTDRFIRTLGWHQAGERDVAAASPEARRALDQYAAGVNAYIDAHYRSLGLAFVVTGLQSGLGRGLDGYVPERWTAVDSAAFSKVQAWSLGGNWESEVWRLAADARFGDPAITDRFFQPYAPDAPVIVPTGAPGSGGAGASGGASSGGSAAASAGGALASTTAASTAPARSAPAATISAASGAEIAGLTELAWIGDGISRLAGFDMADGLLGGHGIGSNDWVVGPAKSATGTALLANDPHLGIQMPSIWYMNGLHCRVVSAACPYDVVGVSFAGVPAVILGHNARIAWGVTNVGPDVQDLFMETPDPADPQNRYLFKGASEPFTTRIETIKVAGGDPVTITVRETRHGPIVNDVVDRLKGSSRLYALRWSATAEPDGILDAFIGLNRASNWEEFRAALRSLGAPSQNFVYADVDGNIGYQMPGRIPIRASTADRGDRPVDGASGAHEWTGWIPFDDLPRLYNPPDDIIVTANNAVVDERYPYFIGQEWDAGWRASRILQLLDEAAAAGGGVTLDELAATALDTRLLRADGVIPALLAARPTTDDGRRVRDLVRHWDRRCDVDSRGCAAYEVTEYRLLRGLIDPWLGELARDYAGTDPSRETLRAALADPANPLWDDPGTPAVETLGGHVDAALDAAGAELRTALGEPSGWAWGRLHTGTFREQTLGTSGIGPLEWYFDAGPYAMPGTADAVLNAGLSFGASYPDPADPNARPGSLRDAFEVAILPSYRFAIDLQRPDAARIVQTTGQSGNPFDRHYGDLVDDWLAGRTVPLPFSREAVAKAGVATLVLEP